jgi:hypothetical protein
MSTPQKLAIEMGEGRSYGSIHAAGCRDLRDPESLGSASTKTEASALAEDLTGWDEDEYHFAPCVKLPK